jgi:hypothetical protein
VVADYQTWPDRTSTSINSRVRLRSWPI